MSHTSREKLDLVNRTKKVIGQLESVLRALNDDEPCADALQRLAAARAAINSLMAELMEDHIRNHMPRNSKSSGEAADDVIHIVAPISGELEEGRLSPRFSISSLHQDPAAGVEGPEGDTAVRRIFTALVFGVFLNVPAVRAQAGPVEGGHELQVWTGGGHGLNGSQSGDGVWNVGFRYGLILTAPHGPGFLRGPLEDAGGGGPG